MEDKTVSILIVDDDPEFSATVSTYLIANGFHVLLAQDAPEARKRAGEQPIDLYLLDLMLPGTSGKVLCREISETSTAGILIVSVLESDDERIALLEMGADDYLIKPFNPRELLARIRAYLRRSQGRTPPATQAFGPWRMAAGERRLIHRDGETVTLTPSEARIMRIFVQNPGLVFEREELLAVSRIRQVGEHNDRSVDNLIKRLRRKIEADPARPAMIETVWGRGYVFRPLPPEP